MTFKPVLPIFSLSLLLSCGDVPVNQVRQMPPEATSLEKNGEPAPNTYLENTNPPPNTTAVLSPLSPSETTIYSGGVCPNLLTGGPITFQSNGLDRQVELIYPDILSDAMPVVFVWHWLGGSATNIIDRLELRAFSNQHQAVVVVPSMASGQPIWGFIGDPTNDLTLFDDIHSCLAAQIPIDLWKISTLGLSAGGLWSTYLSIHRAGVLASGFIMSGGTRVGLLSYKTPETKLPMLLAWGGSTDTWGSGSYFVDLNETTQEFATKLNEDGHFVVKCNHGKGHTLPPEAKEMAAAWLLNHSFGIQSPYQEDISDLPSYCTYEH